MESDNSSGKNGGQKSCVDYELSHSGENFLRVTHLLYEECNNKLYLLQEEKELYKCVTDEEELNYISRNVEWEKVKGKKININGRYPYKVFEGHDQSGTRLYYGIRKEGVGNRIYKLVSR